MDRKTLDALTELCRKATPGDAAVEVSLNANRGCVVKVKGGRLTVQFTQDYQRAAASCEDPECDCLEVANHQNKEDADFYMAARMYMRPLIDVVAKNDLFPLAERIAYLEAQLATLGQVEAIQKLLEPDGYATDLFAKQATLTKDYDATNVHTAHGETWLAALTSLATDAPGAKENQ